MQRIRWRAPNEVGHCRLKTGAFFEVMDFSHFKNETAAHTHFNELLTWAATHSVDDLVAYVEKVSYKKGDGGKGSFTFGRAYQWPRSCLLAANIKIRNAVPALWQGKLGCMTGGDKNVSKQKAMKLFPTLHAQTAITHATADALLIAEYGRRRLSERKWFGHGRP